MSSSWINRALEALWLLLVVLVPLAFIHRDYAFSEAVIAYVEVPKVALLRTLVGLMTLLWLIDWGIQGRFPTRSWIRNPLGQVRQQASIGQLANWLREEPTRWLSLAVAFFLGTTLVSTFLSGSFATSLWGEIPGQDGYSAYTVAAYVLIFAIISTRLKTRLQMWRLLGAIVAMGVLITGNAVLQHYGYDFFDLIEETGGGSTRVTSFMGNAIFAAAVMCMTIPVSLAAAAATMREPKWALCFAPS